MALRFIGIRRVDHAEERRAEAAYWATQSMADRVRAGWDLAEQDLMRRRPDAEEKRPAFTLRRVRRAPLGVAKESN